MMICANDGSPARCSISLHREGRVLLRHHDAGAQPRLRLDEGLELPVVDRVRQRRGEFQIALLHAALGELHQHAVLDAVGVEMLPPHQFEIGAGRAVLGKGIDAQARRRSCAARRAGRTGPAAGARRRSSCARASAPPGTDRGPTACGTPDGCRNRRWRASPPRWRAEPECSSHGLLVASRHYRRFAPPRANADRSPADCRSGSAAPVSSDSPSGSTSSPSNCQCG